MTSRRPEAVPTARAATGELARKAGALSELPLALSTRSMMLLFAGDVTTATALTDEGRAVIDATGSQFAPYAALGLAALQGRQAEVPALIEATASDVALRGEGIAMSVAEWANALLHRGRAIWCSATTVAEYAAAGAAQRSWPLRQRVRHRAGTTTTSATRAGCTRWPGASGRSPS